MFPRKKTAVFSIALLLLVVVLAACQPEQVEVTRVVEQEVTRIITETVIEEGEEVEVTRVITEEVIVEVPAEEEEMEEVMLTSPNPEIYTYLTFGDIAGLDPSLSYDNASSVPIKQILEPLITFNHNDATTYVPVLATEVPSVENGGVSEDGLTYTFNIREGVSFHEGGTLEPHDVAYTFQRGLLQSDPGGPQWLLVEPILGFNNCYDITEGIDAECNLAGDVEAVAAVDPAALLAVCEQVQEAVVADDGAGTVTFNLALPWGPFMATVAEQWGHIIDSEWAIEQGAWDGDCGTWQNHYAPGQENSKLAGVINGTGPYMLDHWTPGEEWVITANENYWREEGDEMWPGGPSGTARIKTVVSRIVNEWGTRFAALQAGDADRVAVNTDVRSQVDQFVGEYCDWDTFECEPNPDNPSGQLRKWDKLPGVSRTDAFMVFDIPPESAWIGSGELDGNGIPPDFFSDIHVRRAMNYCFDFDTHLAEAQNGEAVRNNGPIIQGMLGYNPDGPMYELDIDQCAAELEQAHGGVLPETGFRFSILFNTGNDVRQTAAEILQANLASINPLYQVDIVGVPWPTFLSGYRSSTIPIFIIGWGEDIHDPHNWVVPYTTAVFGPRQHMGEEIYDQFAELINTAVTAADPADREAVYAEFQQLHYELAPQIIFAQPTGAAYEQRWVDDWYYRVGQTGGNQYYYAMGLEG